MPRVSKFIYLDDTANNWSDAVPGSNIIYAGGGNDTVDGGWGNDQLYGGSGNDHLYGGEDSDYLNGGIGDDYLDGGWGHSHDTLAGGFGMDTFVVRNNPVGGDVVIQDFVSGVDRLELYYPPVSNWTPPENGQLGSEFFVKGTAALDLDDFYIYDRQTGKLYYDVDGAYSSASPVLIATLVGKPDLQATDLFVSLES